MPSRFKRLLVLGQLALVGLIPSLLIPATSAAVTISLVPDRPPTIGIGKIVNINVFIVLDAADQAAGIAAVTLHLEKGSAFVDVAASGVGCVFTTCTASPNTGANDWIGFFQVGPPVNSAEAFLGFIRLTGREPGSYDMRARRFGKFPLITAPGDVTNRYDFTSDETLTITIVPESSSWLLLSLGIAGLVMIRRKLAFRSRRQLNKGLIWRSERLSDLNDLYSLTLSTAAR